MRIGIVTQWFAPEEATLPNSVARASVQHGDEVVVLTAFPSYPAGVIYDGYSQQSGFSEHMDGALVHRVKTFLSHDSNAINRFKTFASFALASARRTEVLANNDVNYVYATPVTAAWAAWWARIRHGVPYVLHVQDLWPDSVTSSGMVGQGLVSKVLHFLISLMIKPLYACASEIVAIAPTMARTIIDRGVPRQKVSTVLNWDADVVPGPQEATRPSESIRFVYAGNLGLMQDVETIVRAAALVEDCSNIEFHIYGSGIQEKTLVTLVDVLGISNVKFHGRVSRREMDNVYASSDFQLVTLADRPLFRMTIPSKFQASLANGVPVVTTVSGDLSELCIRENVGLPALPENPASLAAAIRAAAQLSLEARTEMSQNCRNLYSQELSPEHGLAAIRTSLERAARCG
ncbi:glycosyltransferase WbuB [Arthrobacter sp. RT-1]|uniref:glycosyltransferase family 4 protein n=1 Tax=Arthrobacter sp. RT-1 TaxID=2292263 RepID=UPI000E1F54A9|nr:glycosyltransferase family 4 protein [Arthrobacter sp. RT-1]RDV09347.1 glycosyltransferase WbuB [Arthrobacter sp. RT-1]